MATAADGSEGTALAGITPRWEWRTTGDPPDATDVLLASRTPERERASDERYILSVKSDASVKVRDGLMDVKILLEIADDGPQLWIPTLKTGFPMSRDDVRAVLAALRVEVPGELLPSYGLEAMLADLIVPHPDLLDVSVHKERSHYLLDGCMVESTEITADGARTRTVTVESTDPSQVTDTVRRLGLAGSRNTSVAGALKALVGIGAERRAVIDIGTNSVKYHVGERRADGSLHAIVDRSVVTRLGEGQSDSGTLAEEPISRTIDTIAAMVDDARRAGVDIAAVGTAGLRRAPNRASLVDAVRDRTGVTVDVISGEEEARLAYLAAVSALPAARGPLAVFDSGGGSTQITIGRDDHVDDQFSLDIGAVLVAERFGLAEATPAERLDEALAWLSTQLDRLDHQPRTDAVVAIGGTSTNLAAVAHGLVTYDPDVVHGTVIDRVELDRQIELYRSRSADERRRIAGLQPARAEVILGGACIVRAILTKLDHDSMTVSDRGLRHGVLASRLPE